MQLAAAFVEYLITGIISLVWLLPLLGVLQPHLPPAFHPDIRPPEAWAVILLAGLYVVGLLLDFVAYKIMRKIRKRIRLTQQKLNEQYDEVRTTSPLPVWSDHALIWTYAPELAKTLEAYSTRDRIARGVVLNFWIAAVVYPFFMPSWIGRIGYVVGFVALSGVAYAAWFRFQSLSRELKKRAVMTIVTKARHSGAA
jgi:protein-S-isoprenylcysteine O-methyltransferase Ste14